MKLCNNYGIVRQSFPGYTPEVNAYVERLFRTISEMSICQLGQFDMDEEYWEDARSHGTWLHNHVPPARMIPGEPWLSPLQRQYPEGKVPELFTPKTFGTVCWTHIERRTAKSDLNSRGEEGVWLDMMTRKDHSLREFIFHPLVYMSYMRMGMSDIRTYNI